MAEAVPLLLEQLAETVEPQLQLRERLLSALRGDAADDLLKEHLEGLRQLFDRFASKGGYAGRPKTLTVSDFETILETLQCHNDDFQPRQAPLAFRLGMMLQAEECLSCRFQDMHFVEFLYSLGAVAVLRNRAVEEDLEKLAPELFEILSSLRQPSMAAARASRVLGRLGVLRTLGRPATACDSSPKPQNDGGDGFERRGPESPQQKRPQ